MTSYKKKRILLVDDEPSDILLLATALRQRNYTVFAEKNGEDAFKTVMIQKPDIIILDINMKPMNGYQVIQKLKKNEKTRDIPVLFLTALGEGLEELFGLELGAVDYIIKPPHIDIVCQRINNHLELKQLRDNLQEEVVKKTKENVKLYETTIDTLADIIEYRSQSTSNHSKRVSKCTELLARLYGLDEQEIYILERASVLHDVGKNGIPDAILLKPDELTAAEWKTMKEHTTIGQQMLSKLDGELGEAARIAAYQHHERWDGTGYPRGLKGDDIHIYGRIVAVIDSFDAMTDKRPYSKEPPKGRGGVLEEFRVGADTQFEPKLAELFCDNINAFLEIKNRTQSQTKS